jgi:hypothetical protein
MERLELWLQKNARLTFWILGILAGAFQMLAERDLYYPDLIPYLNIAQMYVTRGWHAGINGFWSPLYSWLLSPLFALRLAQPSSELLLVHILNFLILLATMASFDFFLRTCSYISDPGTKEIGDTNERIFAIARAVAYLIFLRLTLHWLPNGLTTPDQIVACFIFLAAAFLVRLHLGTQLGLNAIGLGASLAFAYLGKAAMFPLAIFTFLLVSFLTLKLRGERKNLLLAPLTFLLIASPFLISLSAKEGKATFGESGRVAYLMYGAKFPGYFEGEDMGGPTIPRGFRRIDLDPPVFVFTDAFPGSYFPSTNPSIWYKGYKAKFHLKNELLILRESIKRLGDILGNYGEIPAALFALIYICQPPRRKLILSECWFLALPALFIIGMYSLVLVIERYLAGFLVLLWVGVLISTVRACSTRSRMARPVLYGLLFVLLAGFTQRVGRQAISTFMSHPNREVGMVNSLASMGLNANSKIGVLGVAYDLYLARVGHYSIVASVPPSSVGFYLAADTESLKRLDEAFAQAGAQALMMHNYAQPMQPGWKNIPASDLYIKFLEPSLGQGR